MAAPEEVASLQLRGAYGVAAHVAGHPVAPVDVDLAPVVVATGRSAHSLRYVLRADGVDASGVDALPHEDDEVVPHRAPLAHPQRAARAVGIDPVPEEHLRAVDVAD